MNERAPLPETLERPPRGRVLLLAPHADDDVIGCGGTVCKHALQGDPVRVLIAYDGLRGDPEGRYDPLRYRELRREEARRAGRHLGFEDYRFLDYPEGHEPTPGELRGAAERLADEVRDFTPDFVYAPWIGEHHIDHHVLARAIRLALHLAGFEGEAWGYEVWTALVPTRIVDVTDVHERKVRALAEHQSQLEYRDLSHKALAITAHRAMYLSDAARHGEAFAPLGPPTASDADLLAS